MMLEPVAQAEFKAWCQRFRDLLMREWPGLIGLIIDGGVHDLLGTVFAACRKRNDDSEFVINEEIERWTRLEFPDMTRLSLKAGSLNVQQEEDLDLELGLC